LNNWNANMGNSVQFSIRLLLMATAAIAAVLAAAKPKPTWQSCLAMESLAVFFASIAVMAVVKCRGGLRVFWIAAATPASIAAVTYFIYACIAGMSSMMMDSSETLLMIAGGTRFSLPVIWCVSLANGMICWAVWAMVWMGKKEERANDG
jgi:hypothetical protein